MIEILRSKILFNEQLSETMDSLNKMTLDEVFWLNEQIEAKNFLQEAYRFDHEQKMNNHQQG